jgi:hypothetical protein
MGSFANVERGSRVQTADGILANECPQEHGQLPSSLSRKDKPLTWWAAYR